MCFGPPWSLFVVNACLLGVGSGGRQAPKSLRSRRSKSSHHHSPVDDQDLAPDHLGVGGAEERDDAGHVLWSRDAPERYLGRHERDALVAENDALKSTATQVGDSVGKMESQVRKLLRVLPQPLDLTAFKDGPQDRLLNVEKFDNTAPLLMLSVRDNGPGIESQHLDKIFDPFYTTKDVGEGMGLGLAICYRIVRECEGQILVRTEPGKFCEFTLEFPAKGQQ